MSDLRGLNGPLEQGTCFDFSFTTARYDCTVEQVMLLVQSLSYAATQQPVQLAVPQSSASNDSTQFREIGASICP